MDSPPGLATRTGEMKYATTQRNSKVPIGVEGRGCSLGTRTTRPLKGVAEQNHQKQRNAQNRLHILTLNCKYRLKDAPTKDLLLNQLSKFKYDVIGLCETRAKIESRTKWVATGDEPIIGERNGQHCVGGVGFIINNRITNRIIEVQVHSHRIATLKLDIGKKTPLLIIQIYAPHKEYGMHEIEKFYAEVEKLLDQAAYQKIVMGDFNAQLGPKSTNQKYLGKFTSGT